MELHRLGRRSRLRSFFGSGLWPKIDRSFVCPTARLSKERSPAHRFHFTAQPCMSPEPILDLPARRTGSCACRALPPIVRIVLTQAARHRAQGRISAEKFETQLQRLSREELEPRGLTLIARDLRSGTTRFLIKSTASGRVQEMIEVDPEEGSPLAIVSFD